MARASGKPKLTLDEMQRIALSTEGECLSTEYVRGKDKLEWRCKVGHYWTAAGNSIKQGSWCPACAREENRQVRMLGIEECRKTARERGGDCLSTEYEGSKKPLLWRCHMGHEWSAQANSVRNGHWCLTCANEKKSRDNTNLSIESMRNLAGRKGGRCLSIDYRNVYHILEWECALGHTWETAPSNIKSGHWCPTCSRGLSERLCRAIFLHLFSAEFPTLRPKWLLGELGRPLELDGYCEQYKVAFEYHGAQHFMPVKQFKHGEKSLAQLQARDNWKREACRAQGITLIEIPYTVSHDELEVYIRAKLKLAGIEMDGWKILLRLDITKVELLVDPRLAVYQELAKQQGGECLSPQYLGQRTELRWRCAKGHEWLGYPSRVRNGVWCRACRIEMSSAKHRAETLTKIKAHLIERGGQLLSKKFEGHNAGLELLCEKGHVWSTSWASLRHGTKCPTCGRQKLKVDQQHEIVNLVNYGQETAADVARLFNIHPTTVWRLLQHNKVF